MAIAMYFSPSGFNAEQYDAVIAALDAAGAGNPAGRTTHVCFGEGDNMQVFDVWDSQEAFDEFGATLMPILEAHGVDPGTPMVAPVHNVIG